MIGIQSALIGTNELITKAACVCEWQTSKARVSAELCYGWFVKFVSSLSPLSLSLCPSFSFVSGSYVGRSGRCFSEQAHPAGWRGAGSSSGETHHSFAETGGGREGCRWEWEVCALELDEPSPKHWIIEINGYILYDPSNSVLSCYMMCDFSLIPVLVCSTFLTHHWVPNLMQCSWFKPTSTGHISSSPLR